MRVICTSGSVGAPGEQSPGATRPDDEYKQRWPFEFGERRAKTGPLAPDRSENADGPGRVLRSDLLGLAKYMRKTPTRCLSKPALIQKKAIDALRSPKVADRLAAIVDLERLRFGDSSVAILPLTEALEDPGYRSPGRGGRSTGLPSPPGWRNRGRVYR